MAEDHGEKQPQDMDGRNPLQFIAVCGFEDLTNLVLQKKRLDFSETYSVEWLSCVILYIA